MGVAVLNPRDCLQNPFSARQSLIFPPPRRLKRPENVHSHFDKAANRAAQPNRRKRSPNKAKLPAPLNKSPLPRPDVAKLPAANNHHLVVGQVKILKRGEQLVQSSWPEKSLQATKVDNIDHPPHPLALIDRMDPNSVSVPPQIRLVGSNRINGFYAGSAFATSPSPSSLPLPAFVKKKTVSSEKKDDATSDLYRILGLNL